MIFHNSRKDIPNRATLTRAHVAEILCIDVKDLPRCRTPDGHLIPGLLLDRITPAGLNWFLAVGGMRKTEEE